MYSRRFSFFISKFASKRHFHNTYENFEKYENPFKRTWRILKNDVMSVAKPIQRDPYKYLHKPFPSHCDILVVGGGAIGSSIAYWLEEKTGPDTISVVVVEKDKTYAKCSTTLSVGGLRQQFSLPENIQMSLYGAEFLRTLKTRFGKDADVFFTPHGYLVLASEDGADQLIDNYKLQRELGAVNTLLGKQALKARFPWMDVSDVEMGCLGLEKEGWFDPWALLTLLKSGAQGMGAQYVEGEVVDFVFENRMDVMVAGVEAGQYQGINEVVVKVPSGEHQSIRFAYCILAAGADSGEIAQLARIGTGPGMLRVSLPVEKRKRYVYRFDCQGEPPGINSPMVIDHSGAYFRRDGLGGSFIGGLSPLPEEEPPIDNLDVDHTYFDEKVWPILAKRVPAFDAVKVKGAWSGYYDYNVFDENGIVGPHPYYYNLYMATGFSGHGIQQAPAVGRAVAEMILDGGFQTIDLTRLGFDRLIVDKPMYEVGII